MDNVNYNNDIINKKIKYSIKLIPYFIYEKFDVKDLYLLLGKDGRWKEWTAIGGMFDNNDNDINENNCILNCLNREINEETKELLELKNLNLQKCIKIKYKTEFIKYTLYSIIVFVRLNSMKQIKDKIKFFNTYNTNNFIKNKYPNTWRKYFELEDLQFVKVNDMKFYDSIYNTFNYLYLNKHKYKFDLIFYNDLINFFSNYKFKVSKFVDVMLPKFDPKFLQGLFLLIPFNFYIEDFIPHLFNILNDNKNVCCNCF
jgi:hypothetical protein